MRPVSSPSSVPTRVISCSFSASMVPSRADTCRCTSANAALATSRAAVFSSKSACSSSVSIKSSSRICMLAYAPSSARLRCVNSPSKLTILALRAIEWSLFWGCGFRSDTGAGCSFSFGTTGRLPVCSACGCGAAGCLVGGCLARSTLPGLLCSSFLRSA